MCDEKVGEAEFFLEVLEEVDDLGLNGDIEGADGFVANDEFGFNCEGTGDADTLTLATGEFMRVTDHVVGLEADFFEEFCDAIFAIIMG